jgi:hypothetical protein
MLRRGEVCEMHVAVEGRRRRRGRVNALQSISIRRLPCFNRLYKVRASCDRFRYDSSDSPLPWTPAGLRTMKRLTPNPETAHAILRVLRPVALSVRTMEPRECAFIDACQNTFGTSIDLDAFPPIAPDEGARCVQDRDERVAALALFAFHMGVELPNVQTTRGKFDYGAFERAWTVRQKLRVDLREWDRWPYMSRSLEVVRVELGPTG